MEAVAKKTPRKRKTKEQLAEAAALRTRKRRRVAQMALAILLEPDYGPLSQATLDVIDRLSVDALHAAQGRLGFDIPLAEVLGQMRPMPLRFCVQDEANLSAASMVETMNGPSIVAPRPPQAPSRPVRPRVVFQVRELGTLRFARVWDEELDVLLPLMERLEVPIPELYTKSVPAIFLGGESLLGPSSRGFDRDQHGFAFPVLLEVRPAPAQGEDIEIPLIPRYLVRLVDRGGSIAADFYRPVDTLPQTRGYPHQPVRHLSGTELIFALEWLVAKLGPIGKQVAWAAGTFYRAPSAGTTIYGRENGELFSRDFDDPDEWRAEVARLEAAVKEWTEARALGRATDLLDAIAGSGRLRGG